MTGKLDGKVTLVTGASSGIGEATALAMAEEGARVAIMARRQDRLEDLAKRIGESKALIIVGDVADLEQAQQAVKTTNEKFGRLDILVNNAGLMLLGPIDAIDISDWQRMVNVNVLGLMYCTHAAVPIMKAQKQGHIVNISSVAGRICKSTSAGYNATKWAVGAFSESLRQSVCADNIRVTIIEPGAVATELTDHITHKETKESIQGWVQSMQVLTSEDIAASIMYAVTQPQHVNVNEILIRPTTQLA
jgi:NADP-dependent 3-hydroxy acid dehydrogenase YdfG